MTVKRHRRDGVGEVKDMLRNCTVRALPRWSPTRVLDTPMELSLVSEWRLLDDVCLFMQGFYY